MKVVLHSTDFVASRMAGPGIRNWELAQQLALEHTVTLAIPNETTLSSDRFSVLTYRNMEHLAGNEVVVCQVVTPELARAAARHGLRIIVDAYDPMTLEHLERRRYDPPDQRRCINGQALEAQNFSFRLADSIVCASEKQRDLWIGTLVALGLVTPELYDGDPSLRTLIDVVPFGLPAVPPVRSTDAMRARLGIGEGDCVFLWGGGIWEWFDPLTPIKAIARLARARDDIKLVFMGLQHPNPEVEEMDMARRAVRLAESIGVKDRSVFFNFGWVPYEQRADYLLDADAGISMHFDNVETRYAFRTRMLDYIWAGLPMVATVGDAFAERIAADGLGITVGYEDVDATVDAFARVADDRDAVARMKERIGAARPDFHWDRVVRPLARQITHGSIRRRVPRRLGWELAKHYGVMSRYLPDRQETIATGRRVLGEWLRRS